MMRGRWSSILVSTVALASWDLFLDPMMVADGHWIWDRVGFTLPGIPGIPAVNFLGWFTVGLVLFGWWALIVRPPTRPSRLAAADLLGPALYLWTWIGETVAHSLFFAGWSVAVASFVAMGAFALPALVRLRRGSASA